MVGYFDLIRGNFVIYFKFIRFKSESWRVVINISSFTNYFFIENIKKTRSCRLRAVEMGDWGVRLLLYNISVLINIYVRTEFIPEIYRIKV